MSVELARIGGLVAAGGFVGLVAGTRRELRLAGLAALAFGALPLLFELAPDGRERALAAALPIGLILAAGLAVLLRRWPWLLPVLALACVPARIPVDVGDEEANLLLPLYGVIAAAALLILLELLRGDRRAHELGALTWPVAALVGWSGLSLLWTDDLRQGGITLLAFMLPFGVLALGLARLDWSRRWLTVLFGQLLLMAVAFAAVGILQWVTRDVFWNPKVIVGNSYAPFFRVNSVFWDPSVYGRFLVVAILAALAVVLFGAGNRLAIALTAAIAAAWVGLLFSFSQSSFTALLAGVLAAAASMWRWRAVAALAVAAAVLLSVGFSAPSIRNELADDLRSGLNKASSNRFDLVTNGVGIAADHPFAGVGLGAFKSAYAERTGLEGREPKEAASHNTPVTVAAELGLPGLMLFAWLVVTALLLPFRRASKSFAGRASLAFGLMLAAILVHSLFYNALFEDPFTWGLLGLSALAHAWRTSETTRRVLEPPAGGAA